MTTQSRPSSRPATAAAEQPLAGVRWALAVPALAYAGYVGLLVTCDLLRVPPLGFLPRFDGQTMILASVEPGSPAARAGLVAGDAVRGMNGQPIAGRLDWQRVRLNMAPSVPLTLEIERGDRRFTAAVPVAPSGSEPIRGAPRPGLMAFRVAQVVTLGLALVVAFKRFSDPSALLGAWLLASIATVSLVLPMRLAVLWRSVPTPLDLLLWIPFAMSAAVGPLLFVFFAVFPRRTWPWRRLGLALVPAVMIVAWHVYTGYHVTRPAGAPIGIPDLTAWIFAGNAAYAIAAVGLLLARRTTAESLTDQRRVRVLLGGSAIGVGAGAALLLGYWRNPGADIFATPALTVLSLVFLATPASFAYAILRHRLFDISLIVRQGVRYAFARRSLDALIPALFAVLIVDVMSHRSQPLGAIVSSHWWSYAALGGVLVVVRRQRERWLNQLDRRFFRERYDAERLLRHVADQVARASTLEAVAPAVMHQIEEALHPEFADLLTLAAGEPRYRAVASVPADRIARPLPADLTVAQLLTVLRQPLAVSRGAGAWVEQQLPAQERQLLADRRVELLVPVFSQAAGTSPAAILALGAARSEEPYGQDALDLLKAIGEALGLLLDRSWNAIPGLSECGRCGRCFDPPASRCPDDHEPLVGVPGPRRLNARYRLDRRLGRGGMGTVYAAVDEVLERPVAVKVLRAGAADADPEGRFRREARAAAGFTHPNVVRVYDFGVDAQDRPFLVMELLEGVTLRQRLKSGPLPALEALDILRGACHAVKAAHDHGLVHRDIKPENIFLQRAASGVVPKVLDFGLAKAIRSDSSAARSSTNVGLLVGTLEYMAPEQAAGDVVSPAWDVWSLTIVACEMLTGAHPFRRTITLPGSEASLHSASASVEAPHSLPEPVAAVLQQALSPERALRPADPLSLLASLEAAYG